MKKPKISIVMGYYNRKKHLVNTLWSMSKSRYKNFEVIVVDDGSSISHRVRDLEKEFSFLKVHRINIKDKIYRNPCVPLNEAISHSTGDIIIIQNPECFHYDDIIKYTAENIDNGKYLAFSTLNKDCVTDITKFMNKDKMKNFKDSFEITKRDRWYCHGEHRPKALNFCTAISRKDLSELNGFDERYANGIERDDAEFLERIQRKGMDIVFVDDHLVIHQKHDPVYYDQPDSKDLRKINHDLYRNTTAIEKIIRVNPDKNILE
ncbi:MAG: glycosyltransferase family 2 protein [bacterium]